MRPTEDELAAIEAAHAAAGAILLAHTRSPDLPRNLAVFAAPAHGDEITSVIHAVTQVGGPHTEGPYPRQAFRIEFSLGPTRLLLNETEVIDRHLPPLPGLCKTYAEASEKAGEWLSAAGAGSGQ